MRHAIELVGRARVRRILQGLNDGREDAQEEVAGAVLAGTDPALLRALDESGDPFWPVYSWCVFRRVIG